VLNYIWLALVLLAIAIGGWNDRLKDVTAGAFDGAKTAVTIALALIGIMALWLGVMRLAAAMRPRWRPLLAGVVLTVAGVVLRSGPAGIVMIPGMLFLWSALLTPADPVAAGPRRRELERPPARVAEERREQPVVRPDEHLIARDDRQTPARGADTRIDHRDVNRRDRKAAGGSLEGQGAFQDVVGSHLVGDVHDVDVPGNREDHALHLGHVGVTRAEVGRQRDDRHVNDRDRPRSPRSMPGFLAPPTA